ncbi:MAG: PEP-CTERM sorting domain-containing protein [Akkermansiaceae bacterium]
MKPSTTQVNFSSITKTALGAASLAFTLQAQALDIKLDYGYDTSTDNFFGNATAKAAVDQAAADISALITTQFSAVTGGGYSGVVGSTSATFDWEYIYNNPSTGIQQTYSSPNIAANEVTIFVGVRELSENTLGQGGPAGAGFNFSGGGFSSDWQAAVAAAEAAANAEMSRGAGPVVNTFAGSSTLGSATAFYTIETGIGVGALSFDVDTNNNGTMNTAAELADYWHYDHTTPVAAGKMDLYSVALHEMLHALGIGLSETWDDFISNSTDWTGAEAIAVHGTGTGIIDSGGGHIDTNISSYSLVDGSLQYAAMGPSLLPGTRQNLTELDAAFLRDIGHTTVPEPSHAALLCIGAALLARRKRS